MVKDPIFPDSENHGSSGVIGLASPKDRLASYVLDCVLLLPMVQLIQSPVKRAIFEAMLFEQADIASYFRYFNLLLFVVLFVFYYTSMIWWKGQTLGKMFFSVKVISYQGHLGFYQAFLRSFSMFMEILCLGVPFLAILSHSLRRPIHDRVADTLVISLKNPVGFPGPHEKMKSRLLASLMCLCLVSSALFYVSDVGFSTNAQLNQVTSINCEDYQKSGKFNLENFVELYLTRKINSDCLFEEARDALWSEKKISLSRWAMALAKKDDRDISAQYLKVLCEKDRKDILCQFSVWLEGGEKAKQAGKEIETRIGELPAFAKVFLAIESEKLNEHQKSLDILSGLHSHHEMNQVTASVTFRSLLGLLRWDEAYWVFRTHQDVGDNDFLYFMQREMGASRLSNQEKIQLIELFYPQVVENEKGRQPASLQRIPTEVKDMYKLLASGQ